MTKTHTYEITFNIETSVDKIEVINHIVDDAILDLPLNVKNVKIRKVEK